MKNIWKWLLAVLIGLVFMAGLFGLGFVFYNHVPMNIAYRVAIDAPNPHMMPDGPRIDKFHDRFQPGPFRVSPRIEIQPFGHGFRPFGMGMMFFGWLGRLVPLAILLLLLYIAYQLGKGRTTPATIPAAPAPPPVAAATQPCPECGNSVQEDWKHCPHCGKELVSA